MNHSIPSSCRNVQSHKIHCVLIYLIGVQDGMKFHSWVHMELGVMMQLHVVQKQPCDSKFCLKSKDFPHSTHLYLMLQLIVLSPHMHAIVLLSEIWFIFLLFMLYLWVDGKNIISQVKVAQSTPFALAHMPCIIDSQPIINWGCNHLSQIVGSHIMKTINFITTCLYQVVDYSMTTLFF